MKKYDIPKHRRGDTWPGINSITIATNGVPVNLTNATIKIDFRRDIDTPVALTLSTTNGDIVITQPLQGTFSILPKLIEIPFGTYMYDLQVTFANGVVTTYMEGSWEILADITE